MSKENEKRWQVRTRSGGGYASWRPGYGLPLRWSTWLDRDDLPYEVELDFTTDAAGPQCRVVRLLARDGGEPINARSMRRIPVAECIEVAIASAAAREEREDDVVSYVPIGVSGDLSEQSTLARARGRHQDDHLREVAEVYLSADKNPTQAVNNRWPQQGYSTAARWVMQARRRGFLPPAKPKKGN